MLLQSSMDHASPSPQHISHEGLFLSKLGIKRRSTKSSIASCSIEGRGKDGRPKWRHCLLKQNGKWHRNQPALCEHKCKQTKQTYIWEETATTIIWFRTTSAKGPSLRSLSKWTNVDSKQKFSLLQNANPKIGHRSWSLWQAPFNNQECVEAAHGLQNAP